MCTHLAVGAATLLALLELGRQRAAGVDLVTGVCLCIILSAPMLLRALRALFFSPRKVFLHPRGHPVRLFVTGGQEYLV